jgi:hypothetical protein
MSLLYFVFSTSVSMEKTKNSSGENVHHTKKTTPTRWWT